MNKKDSLAFLDECLRKLNFATEKDIAKYKMAYEQNCVDYLLSDSFDFLPPLGNPESIMKGAFPISSLHEIIGVDYVSKTKKTIDVFWINKKEQSNESDNSLACAA